jgi:hypothetical protein
MVVHQTVNDENGNADDARLGDAVWRVAQKEKEKVVC